MLIVFVAGIDQTDPFGGCVAVSALIQYFTLVSVMWMGAEAVLMFQKLIIVFVQITTRYIVTVSLVCWCKWFVLFLCMYLSKLLQHVYIVTEHTLNFSSCSGSFGVSFDSTGN